MGVDESLSKISDARLSAVESSVREIQGSMQIWSSIIQDGLADLSVQLMAATQERRCTHRKHLEDVTEKHNQIFERLCKVEQQVEAVTGKTQEDVALNARMCKAEQHLEELRQSMEKILVNDLEEACGRLGKLCEAREKIGEQCLKLEHAQSVQSTPKNSEEFLKGVTPATVRETQSFPKTMIYDADAVPQKPFVSSNKTLSPIKPRVYSASASTPVHKASSPEASILYHSMSGCRIFQNTVNHQVAALVSPLSHYRGTHPI